MSSETEASSPESGIYRSGVAARLAGIPVETLRVWERRYGVVRPRLSEGRQRLYSSAEVRRLTLIKQLVDMGHPIGAIAALQTDMLFSMRAASKALDESQPPAADNVVPREVRAALVGPLLIAGRIAESFPGTAMKVVGSCPDVTEAPTALRGLRADIVVIEFPTLNDDSIGLVNEIKDACCAAKAIILYRYAPSSVIRRLRTAGHAAARTSSDAVEIESICLNLLRMPKPRENELPERFPEPAPPPPKFDPRTLAEFANASRTVYCECPRHLVDLVLSLGSFERYSAECANRGPEDAALHRDLERTAGYARAMFEEALVRVAVAEGVPIPPLSLRKT
jgi:DNA-binding transcriptional MerR regulator